MTLSNSSLSIVHHPDTTAYPDFPYAPAKYPELKGEDFVDSNPVYAMVRQALADLGLDEPHFGTPAWNPLGGCIQPGQTVLLKPNWVRDFNAVDPSIDSLVTHAAVLRPILDYVLLALKGKGRIILADAPLQSCDFDNLLQRTRTGELIEIYRADYPNVTFAITDLRKTILKRLNAAASRRGEQFQISNSGDPEGYSLVDLAEDSFLTDLADRSADFRVTNYDHHLLKQHHNQEKHEYLVSNLILTADVVINLPKMKTHIKAGLTGALKNLIGINGHKEFLPHHINGSFFDGGDQYMYRSRWKELHNKIYDVYWSRHKIQSLWQNRWQRWSLLGLAAISKLLDKENLYDGGWFGNETIPRTTLDLNHILYFYDLKKKKLSSEPVRTVFHVVDGIVAGEKNGPLRPRAKTAGVIIAGFNPLIVDTAMAVLIGYQPLKIKTLFYGFYHKKSRLAGFNPTISQLPVTYNQKKISLSELPNLGFWIPKHWRAVAAKPSQHA